MHPDKRRAGRAIRKQRRKDVEAVKRLHPSDQLDAFLYAWHAAADLLADAFRGWGKTFIAAADALKVPPVRNDYALTPGPGALRPSETRVGDPSHSGGQRVTEAHSAFDDDDPFEGVGDY